MMPSTLPAVACGTLSLATTKNEEEREERSGKKCHTSVHHSTLNQLKLFFLTFSSSRFFFELSLITPATSAPI